MNNIIKYKSCYQKSTLAAAWRQLGSLVLSANTVKLRNLILGFLLWLAFCTMVFVLDVNYGGVLQDAEPAVQLQLLP